MYTVIEIQNLKCGGCANTIDSKLSVVEDISELNINNENHTVSFTYTSEDTLHKAKDILCKIGYPIIGDENKITTKAKSFVSCAIGRINN